MSCAVDDLYADVIAVRTSERGFVRVGALRSKHHRDVKPFRVVSCPNLNFRLLPSQIQRT
jgi:hypothetical protein